MQDSIVEKICDIYKKRSQAGIAKYGTTLDRDDLSFNEWANHLREELFDASLYLTKLIEDKEPKWVLAISQMLETGESSILAITDSFERAEEIIKGYYGTFKVLYYKTYSHTPPNNKNMIIKAGSREIMITYQWFEINKI